MAIYNWSKVQFFQGNYWPKDEYLQTTSPDSSAKLRYLPWHLADLDSNGQDATAWLGARGHHACAARGLMGWNPGWFGVVFTSKIENSLITQLRYRHFLWLLQKRSKWDLSTCNWGEPLPLSSWGKTPQFLCFPIPLAWGKNENQKTQCRFFFGLAHGCGF